MARKGTLILFSLLACIVFYRAVLLHHTHTHFIALPAPAATDHGQIATSKLRGSSIHGADGNEPAANQPVAPEHQLLSQEEHSLPDPGDQAPAGAVGGEYDGWFPINVQLNADGTGRVTMCKLDFASHHANPSKIPMFRDLVGHSNCGHGRKGGLRSATFDELRADMEKHPGSVIEPTGFVFHEARVGSTLVANMLASSEQNLVYSESKPPPAIALHGGHVPRDKQLAALRVVFRQMGRGRASGHRRLFYKFQSAMVAHMDLVLEAFPDTPWIFVHRNPVEIMASMFKHGAGAGAPCTRRHLNPPKKLLQMFQLTRAQAGLISLPQYCAAHLAMMCTFAMSAADRFGRFRFVEYAGLVDNLLGSTFPHHFHWAMTDDQRKRARGVTAMYSKGRKGQEHKYVDDSKQKQEQVNAEQRKWATQYVEPLYQKMRQRMSARTAEVAHEAAGGGGAKSTEDGRWKSVGLPIEECMRLAKDPDTIDQHYPIETSTMRILKNWHPDVPDRPPQGPIDKLCHFDFRIKEQRAAALEFRKSEVPFKALHVQNVEEVTKLWTWDYLIKQFDSSGGSNKRRVEQADTSERGSNHFMYWHHAKPQFLRAHPDYHPPTTVHQMTLAQWLEKSREVEGKKHDASAAHWYLMTASEKDPFIERDLKIFRRFKKSWFIIRPSQYRGIHCRFGQPGIVAEAHYDGGRNMIAMLKGHKRYVLMHPRECQNVYLASKQHPSGND